MKIVSFLVHMVPAILLAMTATAAGAQSGAEVTVATIGATTEPKTTKWDAVAEKKKSPYYTMKGYLALKPFSQAGDHFEVPALLANGKCSDPAGEGR